MLTKFWVSYNSLGNIEEGIYNFCFNIFFTFGKEPTVKEDKMSEEKLNLSWSNFESAASKTVRDLFSDTEFADVTLASDDEEQMQAHKVILCAASPFFRRIILKNPHQHPLLFLRNVKMKTLKSVINFIYLGQTEVEQDELETFLAIARDLEIKGLTNEVKEKQRNPTFDDIDEDGTDTKQGTLNESIPSNEDFKHMIHEERISTENLVDADLLDLEAELLDLEAKPAYNESSDEKIMPFYPLRDSMGRYPCNKCDYTAKSPSLLKQHAYGIHEGVRYPCEHCEYKATQRSSLNRHMIRHSQNI